MKVFSYDSALPLTLTGPGQQLGGRLLLFLPRQVLSEGQGDDHLQTGGARAVPDGLHHADGPGVPEDHKLGGGGEGWSTAAGSRIQLRRKNMAVFSVQDSALLSVSQTGLVRSGGGQ